MTADGRRAIPLIVSEKQYKEMGELIKWGTRNQLICKMIDCYLEVARRNKDLALGYFLGGKIKMVPDEGDKQ